MPIKDSYESTMQKHIRLSLYLVKTPKEAHCWNPSDSHCAYLRLLLDNYTITHRVLLTATEDSYYNTISELIRLFLGILKTPMRA